MTLPDRLRSSPTSEDTALAADMLEFMFGQLRCDQPRMDNRHHYRFRPGGWPMTHAIGGTAEEAVLAVLEEIKRNKAEMEAEQ